jgi:anthocyanidin reductase
MIKTIRESSMLYYILIKFKIPDDMAKNSHLKDLQALGSLTVLRGDLDVEGSFDEAVAGCDYAFLVAAPVNVASEDPEVKKPSV